LLCSPKGRTLVEGVRFDVSTSMKMWTVVFWVEKSFSLQGILKMEAIRSSETLVTTTRIHSVAAQSYNITEHRAKGTNGFWDLTSVFCNKYSFRIFVKFYT
jgi:hypothetical protein